MFYEFYCCRVMLFSLHLTEQNHSPNQKITKNDIKNHIKITNHQKMGLFHEQIICLEKPKMQNKHIFFLFGNPNIQGEYLRASLKKNSYVA